MSVLLIVSMNVLRLQSIIEKYYKVKIAWYQVAFRFFMRTFQDGFCLLNHEQKYIILNLPTINTSNPHWPFNTFYRSFAHRFGLPQLLRKMKTMCTLTITWACCMTPVWWWNQNYHPCTSRKNPRRSRWIMVSSLVNVLK